MATRNINKYNVAEFLFVFVVVARATVDFNNGEGIYFYLFYIVDVRIAYIERRRKRTDTLLCKSDNLKSSRLFSCW